jgi:hypothetical protein
LGEAESDPLGDKADHHGISCPFATNPIYQSSLESDSDCGRESLSLTLEDMLRACALQYERTWDKSMLYTEFSNNNSYQESLKIAPFEMLYGHRCQTLLFWSEAGERKVFGPDILQEAKKQVRMVRENLRVEQSRQKSYADHRRRDLSFEVGDFVYLKVSPIRGLHRFKVRGKLAPWFIGPFKILKKRGEVAYQLELPPQLSDMHDVFHVYQLKKCLHVPKEQLPMEDLDAKEDLSYQEYPIKILETFERVTRKKKIKVCKVQWSHHTEEEATWEREEELQAEFPNIFSDPSKSWERGSF